MNFDQYYTPVAVASEIRVNHLTRVECNQISYVIGRTKTGIFAYHDFCPHRGAPLSSGYIQNSEIHCCYHGWSFDCQTGNNCNIPVKNSSIDCSLKKAPAIKEYCGLIWISESSDAELLTLREEPPQLAKSGIIKAQLVNVLENFLEGSHTHYIHNGIVRSKDQKRQNIQALYEPLTNGFKVQYQLETAKGLLTKLIPKKYRNLIARAKYLHPATAILEYYSFDSEMVAAFEVNFAETSEGVRYFARIFLDLGTITPIFKRLASYFFEKIIRQDHKILELQEDNLKAFDGNKFVSDETDLIGLQIMAWLFKPQNIEKYSRTFNLYW